MDQSKVRTANQHDLDLMHTVQVEVYKAMTEFKDQSLDVVLGGLTAVIMSLMIGTLPPEELHDYVDLIHENMIENLSRLGFLK